MYKFKKLLAAAFGLFVTVASSGLSGSSFSHVDPVAAEMDERLTEIPAFNNSVRVPTFSWSNGSISPATAPMQTENNSIGNVFDSFLNANGFSVSKYANATLHTAYRDVVYEGEEVLGDVIADYYYESQPSYGYRYLSDGLVYTRSNTNIYINPSFESEIAFSFNSEVANYLCSVTKSIEKEMMVPFLYFDDIPVAYMRTTLSANKQSAWSTILFLNDVIDNAICYAATSDNPAAEETTGVYSLPEDYLLIKIKANTLSRISEVLSLTWNPAYDKGGTDYKITSNTRFDITKYLISPVLESQQLHIKCVDNSRILVSEIENYDINNGTITLGHSITHERYGVSQQTWFLSSILLSVYNQGHTNFVQYDLNNESEYEDYFNTGTIKPYKFYWGPRYPFDNEVVQNRSEVDGKLVFTGNSQGTGGLIYGYRLQAGEAVRPSHSSIIKVLGLSFYQTDDSENRFEYEQNISNRISSVFMTVNDEITFNYYANQCTALIHVDMYERNESDLLTTRYTATTTTWVVGNVLLPGLGALAIWGATKIASGQASRHTNIQRFYFNFFDRVSARDIPLENVTKLEFKYQLGNYPRQSIEYNYIDASDPSKGYTGITLHQVPNVPIQRMTVEKQYGSSFSTNHTFMDIGAIGTHEVNDCFVDASYDLQIINNVRYTYFFQHIYNTEDNNDWMCYFSPLSIWYETIGGQTVRGTTDNDGYYLTTDAEGVEIVMNVDDPENPSEMTVDEFLERENEDVTVIEYEDPEENTYDQGITAVQNWWNSVVDWFKNTGSTIFKVLAIIAIVIIAVILLILIIKFISWIHKSIKSDSGGKKSSGNYHVTIENKKTKKHKK